MVFLTLYVTNIFLGFDSLIVGHIKTYKEQLNGWLSEAGFGAKYWKPCYSTSFSSLPASRSELVDGCTNKGPTVTILRVGNSVFGGFYDKNSTYRHIN